MIRAWIPGKYVVLGTDGFGQTETRSALRDFFEVDRTHVVIVTLKALADKGSIDTQMVSDAITRYSIATNQPESVRTLRDPGVGPGAENQ